MKPTSNPFLRVSIAAASLALATAVHAADLTWSAGLPGDWNTTNTNWSGSSWNNGTPDNAIFNNASGMVTLTEAITAGSLGFYNGGAPSGGHYLTLTGSNLSVGSVTSWGGYYGPLGGGGVDNISQAYDQRLTFQNITASVSGNATVRRGMLYFNAATVNVGGTISSADAWSVFRSDYSTVTATGGIDFSTIATQIELYGGTVTTPVIKCSNYTPYWWQPGGLYMGNGVTLVATQNNNDFIQVYNNGDTNSRAAATLSTGGMTLDTSSYAVTVATQLNGNGSLTKTGLGTLTLDAVNGNNSYSGGTTVSQGTLKLALGAQSGNPSLGSFSVNGGATLNLDNTNTTVAGFEAPNVVLSGAGTVTKTGVGYISFWNNSSLTGFTGTIDVQQGWLGVNNLGTNANMGQATLNIASGATFDVRYNASLSVDKLTGSGDLEHSYNGGPAPTVTVGSSNGSSTFDGVIKNSYGQALALAKTGSGTFTLSGANTYSGETSVSGGKLVINGNNSGATGAVSVASGATLGGSGTVGGATTISGTHTPGNSPGVQSFSSNLSYASTSIFEWDLASSATGTRGTDYDGVNVGGSLSGTAGAAFKVVLGSGAFTDTFWDTNQSWTDIFKANVDGSGSPMDIASVFSAIQWFEGATNMTSLTGTQGYFTLSGSNLNWTAVPEPTSAIAGLLLTAELLRRRRKF